MLVYSGPLRLNFFPSGKGGRYRFSIGVRSRAEENHLRRNILTVLHRPFSVVHGDVPTGITSAVGRAQLINTIGTDGTDDCFDAIMTKPNWPQTLTDVLHCSASSPGGDSPRYSNWIQYLAGPRHQSLKDANAERPMEDGSTLPNLPTSSTADTRLMQRSEEKLTMSVHHVFGNVKDVTLRATARQPQTFLRPVSVLPDGSERTSGDIGDTCDDDATTVQARSDKEDESLWQLILLSTAWREMPKVLREMMPVSQQLNNEASLRFSRAMMEQAFIAQYCDESFTRGADRSEWIPLEQQLRSLYPYDYTQQPAPLRYRLERCVRALLCSSAYTLHTQWEQYMARHSPDDTAAQVIGLEFVALWWWANPDQLPIELSSSAEPLPPMTVQSQRCWRRTQDTTRAAADTTKVAGLPEESLVEHHLQRFIFHRFGLRVGVRGHVAAPHEEQLRYRRAANHAGGFLCPSAVFSPACKDAMRARVAEKFDANAVKCPLYPRMLEVAIALASTDAGVWGTSAERGMSVFLSNSNTGSLAARRGRELAMQLTHDWLWPVVCSQAASPKGPPLAPSVSPRPLNRSVRSSARYFQPTAAGHSTGTSHPSVVGKAGDWALLVAVMGAISLLRVSLPTLRSFGERRTNPITGGVSDQVWNLAHVRDDFYMPVMRALLGGFVDGDTNTAEALPGWVALVFARVSVCFEVAGFLQRDRTKQPATPACLWRLLFHDLCEAFPSVFRSGNTVTVLWTLVTLEGVCASPASYGSSYRSTTLGKTEAIMAWLRNVSASSGIAVTHVQPCPKESVTTHPVAAHSFRPRAERCQRTSIISSICALDAAVSGSGTDANVPSKAGISCGGGCHRTAAAASLFSLASRPAPRMPLLMGSVATVRQAQAHVRSCAELIEEVVTVAVEVFQRYATLPFFLRDDSSNSRSTAIVSEGYATDEARVLQRGAQPSVVVLLRLVQVLSLFGADNHHTSYGGGRLVDAVARDLEPACHPVVVAYLRKMRVGSAAASGWCGALELLEDASLQTILNGFAPGMGRHRLLSALLWSGLPAAAATWPRKERVADSLVAVFGSGSLAWRVLERNQLLFFASSFFASSKSTRVGHDPHSHQGDAAACLREVLAHLWQLAIAVPEPAHVIVFLWPCARTTEQTESAVTVLDDGLKVSEPHGRVAETDALSDARGARAEAIAVDDYTVQNPSCDDTESHTENGYMEFDDGWPDVEQEVSGAVVELGDLIVSPESSASPYNALPLWPKIEVEAEDSSWNAPVTCSDGSDTETAPGIASGAAATVLGDYGGLISALHPTTPAAQHLFYSLLEVLCWTADPKTAAVLPPRFNFPSGPSGYLPNVRQSGSQRWYSTLAANYRVCINIWAMRAGLITKGEYSTSDLPGVALLYEPATVERITLLLLQTCPDIFLISLLVLNLMAFRVEGFAAACDGIEESSASPVLHRRSQLLPWSIESSLAQVMHHAGVTAEVVQRWRRRCASAEQSRDTDIHHLLTHRALLIQLHRSSDLVGGHASFAGKADLLCSLGSLLLCSLRRRQEGGQGDSLYRYNVYVNEFLLHGKPRSSTAADASTSFPRIILPSLQLTSRSPSTIPPHQVLALQVAWQRVVTGREKAQLRRSFRGFHLSRSSFPLKTRLMGWDSPSLTPAFPPKLIEGEDEDFTAAFVQ